MTNRKALIALRDAVVAGEIRPYEIEQSAYEVWERDEIKLRRWEVASLTAKAYEGSIDAAIALLEAVLPENDHAIELTYRPFGVRPHLYRVTLTTDHTGWGNGKYYKGESETAARALLIAILHALTAKTKQ